jgi:hypothetical protein
MGIKIVKQQRAATKEEQPRGAGIILAETRRERENFLDAK